MRGYACGAVREADMAHVHGAAERNDVEALRALLDINPELVEADLEWDNSKPLHRACQEGAFEAARLLLDRGAGVNRWVREWPDERFLSIILI